MRSGSVYDNFFEFLKLSTMYEVGGSWENLKREEFDPNSMMDGVIHSNIFLCVGAVLVILR